MECIVRKHQEFAGRRIGDRLQRRMQLELGRLQGILEKKRLGKRLGMWQQQVLDTVQVGLQQGDLVLWGINFTALDSAQCSRHGV